MLPLLGRPLLQYTFDHLAAAGVRHVTLACGYLPTQIQAYFGGGLNGLALDYKVERQPLGTGGAIRFAADGVDRTFLALNGDSLREADLAPLLAFHREREAKATILLTKVSDPSRYGLVRVADDGRVLGFLEKPDPEEIDTDLINAGLYVLEPDVFELIAPGRPVSIERDVFPVLAERGQLYALALPGYWLDVGTPQSYLQAHLDLVERNGGSVVDPRAYVSSEARIIGPSVVDAGAWIEPGARVGPLAYVGSCAHLDFDAVVERAAVLSAATVAPGEQIREAILDRRWGVIRA
jgi:mannose-1-phosphate guanylyltransferase